MKALKKHKKRSSGDKVRKRNCHLKKCPGAQQYHEQCSMKDGFSEGFVLGFKVGLAVAASEPRKTAENDEKLKNYIEAKKRAKAWAIKQGFLKR